MKKLTFALFGILVMLIAVPLIAAPKLKVYLVPKVTGFIFWELARDGAIKACDELGADLVYVGTTTHDIEAQVQVFQMLVAQKPECLVAAALDINAPVPVLQKMRSQGTVVVLFDADVPGARDLFVNMAPYPVQAQAMLEAALYNNPKGGKVIWLAPQPTTPNFIGTKKAIDELVAKFPRYGVLNFIDTLYMEDDPEKCYAVATSAMEAHPDLVGFISGSAVAVPVVNKAIQDTGRTGKVYSAGFALPSSMKTYLDNGISKEYAMWSPYWFGYMATYMAIKIKRGEVHPSDGVTVNIPNIGVRKIHNTPDGIVADLNQMLFFRVGQDDFPTGLKMNDLLAGEDVPIAK